MTDLDQRPETAGVERRPGELGPRELVRWTWRQLTSMRTALVLLLLLALAARRILRRLVLRVLVAGDDGDGPRHRLARGAELCVVVDERQLLASAGDHPGDVS